MRTLKILTISMGIALIFALSFPFSDWKKLILISLLGLFVGLIIALELVDDVFSFKMALSFQILSGLISGALAGYLLGLSADGIAITIIMGGLLGWLTPILVSLGLTPIPVNEGDWFFAIPRNDRWYIKITLVIVILFLLLGGGYLVNRQIGHKRDLAQLQKVEDELRKYKTIIQNFKEKSQIASKIA